MSLNEIEEDISKYVFYFIFLLSWQHLDCKDKVLFMWTNKTFIQDKDLIDDGKERKMFCIYESVSTRSSLNA